MLFLLTFYNGTLILYVVLLGVYCPFLFIPHQNPKQYNDHMMKIFNVRYIKEGSTVSVMGVVRRHDNVLMIIPPTQPVSTGCEWARCLLPRYVDGLVLTCDDNQNADVVPV